MDIQYTGIHSNSACMHDVSFIYEYAKLVHTLDIDECSVSDGNCSQICRNTIGDFFCECQDGYLLISETECTGT